MGVFYFSTYILGTYFDFESSKIQYVPLQLLTHLPRSNVCQCAAPVGIVNAEGTRRI